MSNWDELYCCYCGEHVGWLTDSGPRGLCYCDYCKEQCDKEEEEE